MQTIVVLEGDQTGQELLEEALRTLAPDVIGIELGVPSASTCRSRAAVRRRTASSTRRRLHPRARVRPEGGDRDPRGRGRRRLAEPNPARGDRGKGHRPHGKAHSGRRATRRRARPDLGRPHGGRRRIRSEGVARGRRRRRDRIPHRANRAQDLPRRRRVLVPAGRADGCEGLRRPEVHRQPHLRGDAQGGDGRSGRAPSGCAVRTAADRRDVRTPHLVERRAHGDPGAESRRRHPLRPRVAALRFDRRIGVAARRIR